MEKKNEEPKPLTFTYAINRTAIALSIPIIAEIFVMMIYNSEQNTKFLLLVFVADCLAILIFPYFFIKFVQLINLTDKIIQTISEKIKKKMNAIKKLSATEILLGIIAISLIVIAATLVQMVFKPFG